MSVANSTQIDAAAGLTALSGISTPLAGLSLPSTTTASVVAIVNTSVGVLTADMAAGAVVRGNGTTLLWLSGTAAQVNAKLATLAYANAIAGADNLSIYTLASNGTLTPVAHSNITVVATDSVALAVHSLVQYDAGTLTLESRLLNGPDIEMREPGGSTISTACVLVNSTIGPQSQVTVRNDNGAGGVAPRLAIAGRVELDGTLAFAGSATAVSLAQGATFINDGAVAIGAHAAQVTGAGTLINNGSIAVTGDGSSGTPVRIDTSVTGSGVVSLTGGAAVEFGAGVGAGETILLGAGSNVVHLAQPGAFAGQIAGFSESDLLVLDGMTVTAAIGSQSAETDDTVVTLFNGSASLGTIQFSATEPNTFFRLGTDAAGNATIALAPAATSAGPSSTDVYRFFDAAHGSQLLTQDRAERDAIIATRPDLHYEGVGLHALDGPSSDGNTAAVYRFFDVSNGTHFMTASATERDALLASRPDLVFEPNSTLFEHATPEAGDAAVYRFFNQQSGAHFFTADAGERAQILATRPDMTFEGVAFYAPTT